MDLDPRAAPYAAFSLRLTADLLMAMVITGALTKAQASALVGDSLAAMQEADPEHAAVFEEIAAAITSQIWLSSFAFGETIRPDE